MLKLWNKQDPLIFPNGKVNTPQEVYTAYPWAQHTDVVVGISGGIVGSIDNLSILCETHGIDNEDMTAQDALESVIAARKAEAEAAKIPSAEERIAAMLEFQALMSI